MVSVSPWVEFLRGPCWVGPGSSPYLQGPLEDDLDSIGSLVQSGVAMITLSSDIS